MAHLPPLISDLTIILVAAAVVTTIFKKLKQPVVLGYIVAGFLVSPHIDFIPTIADAEMIKIWAEIGVIFLLFALGLEFSFKKLTTVGAPASITAMSEVIFMLALGYLAGQGLGWNHMDSIFLGGVLSISSTTIIIRAFDELGVKTKKFASLVFGVLVVEDLVAILLLVLLSTIAVSQQFKGSELVFSAIKLSFFLVIWFISGIFVLPSLLLRFRKSLNDEMLLILSIALCLSMVMFATKVGFSPALGAFIMGSLLAETSEAKRIEHLIDPVKNLFAAVFFVSVGMLLQPQSLLENWPSILMISIITILGKMFSSTLGAIISGQPLKRSVQVGFSLAQIGEFSFIIATLGLTLNVTSSFLYPIAVAVSVVTTFTTPYLIRFSEPFAVWLESVLPRRVVEAIYRYSSSAQAASASGPASQAVKDFFVRLSILLVVLMAISVLGRKYLFHAIYRQVDDPLLAAGLGFLGTFCVSAPFLWALMRGKINHSLLELGASRRLVFLPYALNFFRYFVLLFIIVLQLSFFSSTLVGTLVFAFISFAIFYSFSRHFERVYDWFEETFLANYNGPQQAVVSDPPILPWDAHLASYHVSANSPHIGKNLAGLSVREKYGVTIVLVERGDRKITAPRHDELLHPHDKLSVIGTDEQLDRFKKFIEESIVIEDSQRGLEDYVLQSHVLRHESPFLGKTIRESGIREMTDGLVVGLERNSRRQVNPDSLTVLTINDVLWIVASRDKHKNLPA